MEDLIAVAGAALVILGVAKGAYNVAVSGFLGVAFGALATAALLSMVLSAVSVVVLGSLEATSGWDGRLVLLRAVLAAFSQPTLTGISLLATILVGGYGCAVFLNAAEDMTILLESHKQLQSRPATTSESQKK